LRRRVAAVTGTFAAGWLALPLAGCGLLKIACDLTLWRLFRTHRIDDL